MSGKQLTKRKVDALFATGKEYVCWDESLVGFGVRVRASGAKSFIVQYRAGHGRGAPVRKLTISPAGKLTVEQARALARKAVGDVAHGHDPANEKSENRRAMSVCDLIDVYLNEHVDPKRKRSTAAGYRYVLEGHLKPAVGRQKADTLSGATLARLHLDLASTPAMANYLIAVVSSMYGFAARRGYVPAGKNPAAHIDKFPERRRERFLTGAELARLGDALREAETAGLEWAVSRQDGQSKHMRKLENRRTKFSPFAVGSIRLLLFTGCRLREVLNLKWEYVDLEREMIFLPDTKTGRRALVINRAAAAVLSSLPRVGPYVFPGDDPERPRHDIKRLWSALCERSELSDVRVHDLRHTFASVGVGGGFGLPIVGKLLGHSQPITTNRYAHLDASPQRRVSERIGDQIARAIDGKYPSTESVPPESSETAANDGRLRRERQHRAEPHHG